MGWKAGSANAVTFYYYFTYEWTKKKFMTKHFCPVQCMNWTNIFSFYLKLYKNYVMESIQRKMIYTHDLWYMNDYYFMNI